MELVDHGPQTGTAFHHRRHRGEHLAAEELAPRAKACGALLAEVADVPARTGRRLSFDVPRRDVYNITAPFTFGGVTLIAGRVERRETEHSEIVLFRRETDERWVPHFTLPEFEGLQDPCVELHGDELVIGGVRFPVQDEAGRTTWRTDFYRGKTLASLRHFLSGPLAMKDVRFKVLHDGKVAVFSRPQGEKGGKGKIGFAVAGSLDEVTREFIHEAPLIPHQFLDSEWGGANEVHLLKNGLLGVLGHIACMDERRHRHYYPMTFCVDPATGRASPIRIIARRASFPPGPAKRDDLHDVVFSGGLLRMGGQAARLYAGLSDAAAAYIELPDPFTPFEQSSEIPPAFSR